ncbi:LysR family transcriptional regulator [Xenorhabdus stockiae]|uniref:LysR family transcriptional regulator n=1 Tax=Xenorhabdus stockiae TaxID=351614 RepID=A0A2D0KLE3_9GAMM|nr:LysR family transcriptional regulator [Xenorhabdus stockiae]
MQSLIWDDIRVFLAVAQTGTIPNNISNLYMLVDLGL